MKRAGFYDKIISSGVLACHNYFVSVDNGGGAGVYKAEGRMMVSYGGVGIVETTSGIVYGRRAIS